MVTSNEKEIKERHAELKAELAKATERHAFWSDVIERDFFKDLINQIKDRIQQCRVQLEDAKSEEIKTLQAQISARKDLMMYLEAGRSTAPVVEARNRLERYEQENALFIVAAHATRSAPSRPAQSRQSPAVGTGRPMAEKME